MQQYDDALQYDFDIKEQINENELVDIHGIDESFNSLN
jgi:hypothetical protein